MRDPHALSALPTSGEPSTEMHLFAWNHRLVVLFGNREGEHWTLARGWHGPGALTDVRRWQFTSLDLFVRQVRRLVLEASGDSAEAIAISARARRWASGH